MTHVGGVVAIDFDYGARRGQGNGIGHKLRGADMRFPIDDGAVTYTCGTAPQPVKDYGNGGQKATEDGEPLFSVGVLAMANGEAELISIKVAGKVAAGVVPGASLKVVGLVAAHWSIDGKSGMAFRCSRIEPVAVSARAAS